MKRVSTTDYTDLYRFTQSDEAFLARNIHELGIDLQTTTVQRLGQF